LLIVTASFAYSANYGVACVLDNAFCEGWISLQVNTYSDSFNTVSNFTDLYNVPADGFQSVDEDIWGGTTLTYSLPVDDLHSYIIWARAGGTVDSAGGWFGIWEYGSTSSSNMNVGVPSIYWNYFAAAEPPPPPPPTP
jgi:hypothetical protein